MPTFQDTQAPDYLSIATDRAQNEFLNLGRAGAGPDRDSFRQRAKRRRQRRRLHVGHFFKGLKRRDLALDYRGFDIEQDYLDRAVELFPELDGKLTRLDLTREAPCRRGLGDVRHARTSRARRPALDHFLEAASEVAILRTFLGEQPLRSLQKAQGARTTYPVNQLSFQEVLDAFAAHDLWPTVVRDRYTDSMPLYMQNGIIRAYYLVVGTKRD